MRFDSCAATMFCCKKLFKATKSFDLPAGLGSDATKRATNGGSGRKKSRHISTTHDDLPTYNFNNNDIGFQHASFRRRSSESADPPPEERTAAAPPTKHPSNTSTTLEQQHSSLTSSQRTDSTVAAAAAGGGQQPDAQQLTITSMTSAFSAGARSTSSLNDSNGGGAADEIDLSPPTPLANVRKEGILSETSAAEATKSASGVRRSAALDLPAYTKTAVVEELIRKAIGANDFLNNMMDEERLRCVVAAMRVRSYAAGAWILQEGEQGDHFYIAEAGAFEVLKGGAVKTAFGPGVVFGELAILYKAKRFASIRVTEGSAEARVWQLERQVFQKIMISTGCQEREQNIVFLGSVAVLKGVAEDVLEKMADLLKREFYVTGSTIICQGDPGDKFYIIRGGRAKVVKRDAGTGETAVVGYLRRGDYFGEHALIHQDKRLASVISQAPGTECLTLDRIAFNKYLGLISELKNAKHTNNYQAPVRPAVQLDPAYAHLQLEQLRVIGTLGIGGFGRVELVQEPLTEETFALKILKKHDIVAQGQVQHAYCEKEIMSLCDSGFVVKLYKTFRNTKYIYFLMEPCLGGDVWTQLQQHKQFAEPTAQFVAGCVIEALEYLHTRNIIYRDLKPENLMVDGEGYVKLVDFGFAKIIQRTDKTWTFSGTPEYVAPEIILNKGHDRAVDYWALGVLVHELLVGKPPFRGKDHMRTYNAILRGIDAVRMSSRIPKQAQHLIRDLCRQIPTDRIGYQKRGIDEIKAHSWFVQSSSRFDWAALRDRRLAGPLRKPIESGVDLSNFEEFQPEREEPPDETSGWDVNF